MKKGSEMPQEDNVSEEMTVQEAGHLGGIQGGHKGGKQTQAEAKKYEQLIREGKLKKKSGKNKEMTVQEAGHRGGEKTLETYGRAFYSKIGRKGGEKRGKEIHEAAEYLKKYPNVTPSS